MLSAVSVTGTVKKSGYHYHAAAVITVLTPFSLRDSIP